MILASLAPLETPDVIKKLSGEYQNKVLQAALAAQTFRLFGGKGKSSCERSSKLRACRRVEPPGMQCGTLRTKRSRAAMKMLLWPDRIKALKLTNCRLVPSGTAGGGTTTRTDRRVELLLYSHQFNSGFFLVNNLGKSQGPH